MQAEKVQLLATAKVLGRYKTRWLHWWNMSKDSRQSYNFPKLPCSIEELRPWTDIAAFWAGVSSLSCLSIISIFSLLLLILMPYYLMLQLEEEAGKLFDLIMEEDQITLSASADNIVPIQRWIEKWSLVLWRRAFREFFSRNSTFSKKIEFLSQADTEKAMKRAVMRYFFRKLLQSGAIQRISLPSRFSKWIDTSSSECVFTLEQKRNFKRPHLMPCLWYIELARTDSCPSEEAALRASCEQQVLIESDSAPVVEAEEDIADHGLTERERAKVASKLARAQAKEREREEKRLAKEQKREERKKEIEECRQLGLKVKKLGLKKVLEDKGISISGSSRPTSSTPISATPGSTYTYSIRTFDEHVTNSKVLVVNSGPDDIIGAFEKLPEGAQPDAWLQISEFIRSNQGAKRRDQHGQNDGSLLVDLVIFDVPENLPVPGIIPAGEVPHWNKLKMRSKGPGKNESPWIHKAFEFASTWL